MSPTVTFAGGEAGGEAGRMGDARIEGEVGFGLGLGLGLAGDCLSLSIDERVGLVILVMSDTRYPRERGGGADGGVSLETVLFCRLRLRQRRVLDCSSWALQVNG